ncbi:MAG: hypothetical protein C0506_16110 [Anaerolinea sp.]|nr:hypothetical protein [Anaerolinea sp.]
MEHPAMASRRHFRTATSGSGRMPHRRGGAGAPGHGPPPPFQNRDQRERGDAPPPRRRWSTRPWPAAAISEPRPAGAGGCHDPMGPLEHPAMASRRHFRTATSGSGGMPHRRGGAGAPGHGQPPPFQNRDQRERGMPQRVPSEHQSFPSNSSRRYPSPVPGPLAYFITFRTYGTWLPGDRRGTADRGYNAYGEPRAPRDDFLRDYAQRQMSQPPFTLSDPMRLSVAATLARICEERDWPLLALNVRTNHVHAVVAATQTPGFVMNRLKSSSTMALRGQQLAAPEARVWARHGSTRHLWTEEQVALACDYTTSRQD